MPFKYSRKKLLKGGSKKKSSSKKSSAKKSSSKKPSTKKSLSKKSSAKKSSSKSSSNNTGLDAVIQFNKVLSDIVKKNSGSRKEATKGIWNHIRNNNLQGTAGISCVSNGRTYNGGQVIMCSNDSKMSALCGGKERIAMTEIAGLISKNSN